jgi:GAF domain-containing protein
VRESHSVPYLTCPECELTTWVAHGDSGGECPRCGTSMRAPRRRFEREVTFSLGRVGFFEDGILQALSLARGELEMDLGFLAELVDGHEVLRSVSGNARSFGLRPGTAIPLEASYFQRVVDGRLPNAVPDAAANPQVRELPITEGAGIGAYIGVPLEPFDGRTRMLCCLSRESRPALGEVDVRFLRGLGETVIATLEARQASDRAAGTRG